MLPSLWTMLNQAIQKREGVGKNKKNDGGGCQNNWRALSYAVGAIRSPVHD